MRGVVLLATAITGAATMGPATMGSAAEIEDLFGFSVRRNAEGALAVLGISAVPNETASALFLNTGSRPNGGSDFQAGQLGGGFTFSETFPLYLEGYIGYNRYDPDLLVTDGTRVGPLDTKWTGFAATGGVGWDFTLNDYLKLRPMLNVSMGQIVTDTEFIAAWIADRLDFEDVHFLRDGGLTAGGLGGSLVLVYNQRWQNDLEADATLRYTNLQLQPIGGDRDVVAHSTAETLALWSRLRMPTGLEAFGRPFRTVTEFSASWLPGDQGDILNTDWLMQVGYGLEIDVSETPLPWITEGRMVFRYTIGESLTGYGLGFAVSF